jgi:hypothetical protein
MPDPHPSNCASLARQGRSWLRYSHPPDRLANALKVASFRGTGEGTGEPDRAIDPAVVNSDSELALRPVPDPFLRALGWASREPPPSRFDLACWLRRSDREQITWLSVRQYPGWSCSQAAERRGEGRTQSRSAADDTGAGGRHWRLRLT